MSRPGWPQFVALLDGAVGKSYGSELRDFALRNQRKNTMAGIAALTGLPTTGGEWPALEVEHLSIGIALGTLAENMLNLGAWPEYHYHGASPSYAEIEITWNGDVQLVSSTLHDDQMQLLVGVAEELADAAMDPRWWPDVAAGRRSRHAHDMREAMWGVAKQIPNLDPEGRLKKQHLAARGRLMPDVLEVIWSIREAELPPHGAHFLHSDEWGAALEPDLDLAAFGDSRIRHAEEHGSTDDAWYLPYQFIPVLNDGSVIVPTSGMRSLVLDWFRMTRVAISLHVEATADRGSRVPALWQDLCSLDQPLRLDGLAEHYGWRPLSAAD